VTDVEIRLAAEYESALGTEAPPCAVDLELARAQGRTLRRRHRAVVTGSSALAVALVAVITIGLVSGTGPGHKPADPDSGGANYSGPSSPPADDPLATQISFGWLPDGVKVAGVTTQYEATGTTTAGGVGMRFTTSVLPRGEKWASNCPTNVTVFQGPGASAVKADPANSCDPPAPNVNGRTAYWLIAPGDPPVVYDDAAMRWQYADDAWAELDASLPKSMSNADVSQLMHRIAQNMHVSRHKALPMPFHLGKVPAGWHFEFASWNDGPDGWQVSASDYTGWSGASLDIGVGTTGPGSGTIQVWENPATTTFPTAAELKSILTDTPPGHLQTLTVDGHQARMLTNPDHKALIVHDVHGFDVVVEAIEPAALAIAGSDAGIIDYYHTLTIFSPDRATWTTHVLG
jgi:hypothetical protein